MTATNASAHTNERAELAAPPATEPTPSGLQLRRPDDQDRAGRVVAHAVRDRPEQEALGPCHALVADHDQVGVALLGDVEDRIGGGAPAAGGLRPPPPPLRRRPPPPPEGRGLPPGGAPPPRVLR